MEPHFESAVAEMSRPVTARTALSLQDALVHLLEWREVTA
jgi:hypothetical protein